MKSFALGMQERVMRHLNTIVTVLFVQLVVLTAPVFAYTCDKFVSPTGTSGGDGSSAAPWSLSSAITGAGGRIQGGHTVCLKEGTYPLSNARLSVSGSSTAPVIFRNAPNERPILDANGGNSNLLTVAASNVWLWGLEFTDSSSAPQFFAALAVSTGSGVKVINCNFHDMGGAGIGAWAENTGLELYGSSSFFNGRNISARGYGIYTQNATGSKLYEDNFFFWNFVCIGF